MDFADFIAPLSVDQFIDGYFSKRPVHIPAAAGTARAPLGWQGLNALLAIQSHWTESNINLIMNRRAVDRDFYMAEGSISPARRAEPAKVQAFLAMGASMVGNAIEEIDPDVAAIVDMLSDLFAGRGGANLYCSFKDVQAFPSHYDNHEVFAVHCEGEKVWRIYRNRADAPLEPVLGDDSAQARLDAAKGDVMMEVQMRPGDLLYIPRGCFHDALASSAESLHVTFAIAPHSGRVLFRLLEEMALRDSAFRRYLPDARRDDGALTAAIDALADKAGTIMRSPAFRAAVTTAQRKLISNHSPAHLPKRLPVEAWARTDRHGMVERRLDGAVLVTGGGAEPLGQLADEAEWILSRPAIVAVELFARYPYREEGELRALIDMMARLQLIMPYEARI